MNVNKSILFSKICDGFWADIIPLSKIRPRATIITSGIKERPSILISIMVFGVSRVDILRGIDNVTDQWN